MPCRAVDGTGIGLRGEGGWLARKHGPSRRRPWRRVPVAMEAGPGDIRAVRGPAGQCAAMSREAVPLQPPGRQPAPAGGALAGSARRAPHNGDGHLSADCFAIACRAADGAHDTRRCHGALLERGAGPILPLRRNGRAWKPDCPAAISRNETLRATRRFGRALRAGALEDRVRLSHPKSGGGTHEPAQAPWRTDHVTRSRPPDRRHPDPHRSHEPQRGPPKGRDQSRHMTPPGKRADQPDIRLAQQCHAGPTI